MAEWVGNEDCVLNRTTKTMNKKQNGLQTEGKRNELTYSMNAKMRTSFKWKTVST